MSKEFVRRDTGRYSKLGKGRKKLQRWRKPTGRDNKMRLKRKGYPGRPTVGHKSENPIEIIRVSNIGDIEKAAEEKVKKVLLARVGAKKKIDLIKKAKEEKIEILNLNIGNSSKEELPSSHSLKTSQEKNHVGGKNGTR
jgi:large subunit ribosomal protein L32e